MMKRILVVGVVLGVLYMFFGIQMPKYKIAKDLDDSLEKQTQLQAYVNDKENDIKKLKKTVNELKKEKNEYKERLSEKVPSYVKQKFLKDGQTYYSETQFFSDKNCTKKIEQDIKILSPVVDELKKDSKSDEIIYVVLTDTGVAYATENPYLTTEKPEKPEMTTEEPTTEEETSTEESSLY